MRVRMSAEPREKKYMFEGMFRCLKTDIYSGITLFALQQREVCIDIVSRILHLSMSCSISDP